MEDILNVENVENPLTAGHSPIFTRTAYSVSQTLDLASHSQSTPAVDPFVLTLKYILLETPCYQKGTGFVYRGEMGDPDVTPS